MKDKRLLVILLIMLSAITVTIKASGQSFYAYKNDPGTHKVTPASDKKKLTAYHKRSLLYKIRREKSYNKKRKQQAKTSA